MVHRSDNEDGRKEASDAITALPPENMDFLVR
jgi:hypothetical protein